MSTQQFSLRWNNYTTYITGAFESLRYEEDLVDVTLCCEGKKIRAHKILLSACSAYFKEIFKENPCQHPVIIFKNVKYTDLLAIVEFMYQGEVSVIQESLPSFLHTAELLSIRGLTDNSTDTRPQQQQQHAQPTQLQQHIIQTQDQNLLQKSITTAESVYLTLPSNSTIVHQPAKLIQTSQPQIINKTIIKPVEILQQVSTATGQSIVTPVTTQTLTAKIQTTQTDYSDLNQQLKRKKIKLHHGSDGDIYETTETTYTVAKAESDDNQMTGEDEQTVEEEYQEATSMKMEIQEYIDASQINDQLNSSNAGSTTYIQADESYELVAEGISVEKDPGTEDDGTMHDSSAEIEQSEMDMNRLLQGTSEEQKTNILQGSSNLDERKHFKCNQCARLFCSMNAMKRHQLSKHNDQKTSYICSICNAVFKTKWSMSTHKSKYHREKMLVVDSQTGVVQEQPILTGGKKKKLDITGTIKEELM